MTDYREIMRLRSLGLNHSQIAESLGASRTTVIHTLQRAAAQGLDWQAAENLNDREIAVLLFPGGEGVPSYKAPDYAYVHRELMKPNVTQQLLWMEDCDQCRDEGTIPYQLTAFKRHYREYAAQTKATMHINRKPGDGPPAAVIGKIEGIRAVALADQQAAHIGEIRGCAADGFRCAAAPCVICIHGSAGAATLGVVSVSQDSAASKGISVVKRASISFDSGIMPIKC